MKASLVWMASAMTGGTPIVLDELGDFENEDGCRVTLFPHHLLFEIDGGGIHGHLLLPIDEILEAMAKMHKEIGN